MLQGTGVFLPGYFRQQLSETGNNNSSSSSSSRGDKSAATLASLDTATGGAELAGASRTSATHTSPSGVAASSQQHGRVSQSVKSSGSRRKPVPRSLSSPALKPAKGGESNASSARSAPTSPKNSSAPLLRQRGPADTQDAWGSQVQQQHRFAVVPTAFDCLDDVVQSHRQQQPWQHSHLLADSPTAAGTDQSHAADFSYSMWLPEEQQQQQEQQPLSNDWLMGDELNMLGYQQQQQQQLPVLDNQVAALGTFANTWSNSIDFNLSQQPVPGSLAGGTAVGMPPSVDLLLAQQQQAAVPAWSAGPGLLHSAPASPHHHSPAASFTEGDLMGLRSNTSSFTGGFDLPASPVLPAGSPRVHQHQQQMMQLQHQQQLLIAQEAALEAVDSQLQMLLERRQALQQARLQAAAAALASTGSVLPPASADMAARLVQLPESPLQAEGLVVGSPLAAAASPLHLSRTASPAPSAAVLPAVAAAAPPQQQGTDLAASHTLQRLMAVQQRQMELQEELLSLLPRLAM